MKSEGDKKSAATGTRRNRLARAGDMASRVGALEPSDPALRRGLHVAIGLALVLGVGLAVTGSAHEFPDIEWNWRPLPLALGALGFATIMLASAEIWMGILRGLGSHLDRVTGVRIWFLSGLGRFVPTSLLLPMVRMAASEREGVPKRICLASIVYEYAIVLTASLTIGSYTFITLPGLHDHSERFLALLVPVLAFIFVQPAIFRRVADWTLSKAGRDALPVVLGGGQAGSLLLAYMAVNAIAGLSVYFLAQSVYPLGTDDIPTVIGAYGLGSFIGMIAFVLPGGLVAREAGLAVGLSTIMPTAPAIAIALLARLVQISVEVIVVTISLARGRLANRSNPAAKTSSRPATR
jgi:hypothetical protein